MNGEFDFGSHGSRPSYCSGLKLTMDSREIAELTQKLHKNVLADIDMLLDRLELQPAEFSARYTDGKGESRRCYRLPFRETMILVSGYSVELRSRVVDRWLELERSGGRPVHTLPDFANPAAAARAWAEQYERALALEPMAQVAQKIATAAGLRTLSEIGKINGIGPRKIFELLEVRGILFRSRGDWVPYQDYIDSGYFVVRERTYDDSEGQPHLRKQVYVTGKGETWLAKRLFTEGKAS